MRSSECHHCWHRSEETKTPICCWCGTTDERQFTHSGHGPFHPVMVAQESR